MVPYNYANHMFCTSNYCFKASDMTVSSCCVCKFDYVFIESV